MILGPVSFLDCFVFMLLLVPQLLIQAGIWNTFICAAWAIPFLTLQLPFQFVSERFLTRRRNQSPFVQQASLFEDLIIRCVRYAFRDIPANIGRVFFSKPVAYPFIRFRMLRHGYVRSPIYWREVEREGFKGLWISWDELEKPDVVVYYCHGGGFSMGSSYFYLEFLLVWLSLLKTCGFRCPAILALEYTLVPDGTYPVQIREAIAGYDHALSIAGDPSRLCVAGDSAGGTLVLSLLLHLGRMKDETRLPGLATLISPWVTLVSRKDQTTASDFLNVDSLHRYARQYVGNKISVDDPIVSPGSCRDMVWWAHASPLKGFLVLYGAVEVFAPEIRIWIDALTRSGLRVQKHEEKGAIHAWPVAALFLSNTLTERQKGLKKITETIREHMLDG